jgi:hypothetical protein
MHEELTNSHNVRFVLVTYDINLNMLFDIIYSTPWWPSCRSREAYRNVACGEHAAATSGRDAINPYARCSFKSLQQYFTVVMM